MLGEAITAASTLSLGRLLDWKHYRVDPNVRKIAGDAVVSVFSQDNEREADIYGAWYAFQAGYDIERGAAVWERVAAVDEKDPFLTTYFLLSDPAPLERMARLKLVAQYYKAGRGSRDLFPQTAGLESPAPALKGPTPLEIASVPRRPPEGVVPPGSGGQPTGNQTVTHVPPELLSTRISA